MAGFRVECKFLTLSFGFEFYVLNFKFRCHNELLKAT